MYDGKFRITYPFLTVDFGGGSDITQLIATPRAYAKTTTPLDGRGIRGRVLGAVVYNITEDFAGSTSDAGVRVGDGTDDDLYFDSGLVLDENVDIGESLWLVDDGSQVDIPQGSDNFTVTFVANAGTPTGIADVLVVVDWYQ